MSSQDVREKPVMARRLLPGLIGIVVVLSAALMGSSTVLPASAESVITQLGADINGEAADDSSGEGVSLSRDGTRVAIGAPGNDDGGFRSGHTRIFRITAVTQDSQRESSENPGPPGIFLTLTTHTPQPSHGYTVTFGAYAIAPNSPYVVTIRNEQTGTQRVLTSATVSPGGHLEKSTQLPQLEAGSHTITISARSNTGAFLTLGNRIVVDGQGNIHSVSPEQLHRRFCG